MKLKRYIPLIFLLLLTVEVNAQCAMCRAVLESDPDGATAEGINKGILYLMAFPYILVGLIGFYVYKSRKKAKMEDARENP